MKYVNWFFGLIVVVIAFVVGTIMIRNIVDNNKATDKKISSTQLVDQIKADTTLRLYVDGPVIADEKHQSMQIDITPNSRTVTLFKTYQNVVFKKTAHTNNQKAFDAFAQALDRAGYTVSLSADDIKYAGQCALGRVYHLEVLKGEEITQDLWTTSCSTTRIFGGNMSSVLTLFKNQIPDYSAATAGSTVAN